MNFNKTILFPVFLFVIYIFAILWVAHEDQPNSESNANIRIKTKSEEVLNIPITMRTQKMTIPTQKPSFKEVPNKVVVVNPIYFSVVPNPIKRVIQYCKLLSNRTEVKVSSNVRGNLGPAEVVLSEKWMTGSMIGCTSFFLNPNH